MVPDTSARQQSSLGLLVSLIQLSRLVLDAAIAGVRLAVVVLAREDGNGDADRKGSTGRQRHAVPARVTARHGGPIVAVLTRAPNSEATCASPSYIHLG